MRKKVCRILLISLFIIILGNIKTFAVSDFSYTLDANGNATITAYNGTESDLTIPNTIDGHTVITIGEHAFDESRNSTNGSIIKNLVISEGIIIIDGWAFTGCENLESVKLPESLAKLDWQIFLGCAKLSNINIPKKLTTLGNGFLEQTAIKEITIPENIQKFIGSEFRLCKSLEKAYIYNDNINYYNNGFDTNVFEGCDSIVLYGNEGSTTQEYAKQKGIEFKLLPSSEEPPTTTIGSINLNKDNLELEEDESEILIVSFTEISSDTKVIWSSSDENVAIVENGEVIAKNVGNAVITVSTEDGKYKDTCNVSVIKKEDIEDGKNINEKKWVETIKLSELKENEIYKYTADSTTQFPKIENDTGNNCLIYIKGRLDDDYKKEINMYNNISSTALHFSFDEYSSGESFGIMYKRISNDELLKLIEKDEIIYLSNYNNGDKLEYQFEKYIYNDTEKDITINTKDTTFGVETSNSVLIPKGEIYEFDWMIDSIDINYSEKNDSNVGENQEQPGKTEKDNTQAPGKLPQTGKSVVMISSTLLIIILAGFFYKKYNKFKDIK